LDSPDKALVNSPASTAGVELLAPHSSFTDQEIEHLFEADSALLRENPYALAAPKTPCARGGRTGFAPRGTIGRTAIAPQSPTSTSGT
jgi:hypothetical protein